MAKRIVGFERKKRSIIRRLLSNFINGSNSYIVQYLPEFVFSTGLDLQQFRREWIHEHKKNNDSDLIRMLFLLANVDQVIKERVPGDIAEFGVYKGNCAKLLKRFLLDGRQLYLLDTFAEFPISDLTNNEPAKSSAGDFSADLDQVRSFVGTDENIHYIVGYFPDTASRIPPEAKFAFVNLDVDLYQPIKAGLEYFYPRLSRGGMVAIHDYANSPWPGVKNAVDEFLINKPEKLVVIPDRSGTAVFRKTMF